MQARFHYWGPLLVSFKVNEKELNQIKKLCSKKGKPYNRNLVGVIKDEHEIDALKYDKILKPYTLGYQKTFAHFRGFELKGTIQCSTAWVNYMKNGESNPPHIHHNCHLSSVLVLDLPEQLKVEQKAWKGTGDGPAALTFFTGNPQNFHANTFGFHPEPGDFFIFPWNLTHSVSSFRSKATRITVAANFKVSDDNIFEKKEAPDEKK